MTFRTVLLVLVLLPAIRAAAVDPSRWTPLRNAIPDTVVLDQDGRQLRFYTDLVKGKTVAINFIFTSCTTVCSPLTAIFRNVQKSVKNPGMKLISISVDPATDRPAVLKEFAGRFGAAPGWTFVTGDRDEIAKLLAALEAFSPDKQQHTAMVLIGNEAAARWTRSDGFSRPQTLAATLDEAATFAPVPRPTPESAGREIYERGSVSGRELTARLRGSDVEVPAALMTCASCHGRGGAGSREGGVQAPPVDWDALRGRYDERSFARAVVSGTNANGTPLHPAMPSYALGPEDLANVVAYLKQLPQRVKESQGVSSSEVRVGAVLPLSGRHAATGKAVESALRAVISEANDAGGTYGRTLRLVAIDSRGDVAGARAAARRLLEDDHVFALVGSFHPQGLDSHETRDLDALLARADTTLVGPVAPQVSGQPRNIYYLLPSVSDQVRVLVDHLHARGASRIALLRADDESDEAAVAFTEQQRLHGMLQVLDARLGAAGADASLLARLIETKAEAVVVLASGARLHKLMDGAAAAGLRIPFATTTAIAGRSAFDVRGELLLAYPSLLPEATEFDELATLLGKRGGELSSPAFQAVAAASARVLLEGLKGAGRDLNQVTFRRALETLRGFETGFVPPISFIASDAGGSNGSYIVRADKTSEQYVPITEWQRPQSGPTVKRAEP